MSRTVAQPSGTADAIRSAAADLALPMSPRQLEQLDAYVGLLHRWNATYNLTAVRDPASMVRLHVADCLAAIAPARRELAAHPSPGVLDVGSGAGLPGVVLSILNPDWRITCIDAVGKKAAFMRQAAGDLGLQRLAVTHGRVESLGRAAVFDLVIARAFSSLADFVTATGGLLVPDGRWLAMKGRTPDVEIAALPPSVEVFHVEPVRVPDLDGERCLVWMRARHTDTEE